MKSPLLILMIFAATATLTGQSLKAYKKASEEALADKNYQAALHYYQEALEIAPDDMGLWFQYGKLAVHFNAYNEAEQALKKVYEHKDVSRFPETPYLLGIAYKSRGRYDEAAAYFQAYLHQTNRRSYTAQATKELEDCRWAKTDQQVDERWKVEHMGRRFNTPYSEFAPVKVGDTLYYSSFRYEKEGDDFDPQRKVSKLLYQKGRGRGRPLTRGFNPDTILTAHAAISTNGQRIYFTRCQYINASEIRCKLVYKSKDKRRRWESKTHELPDTVNLKGYTATQPSVGYDSTAGAEVLYFASDRPGGKGGMDLWKVYLFEDSTGIPQALDHINTEVDELSPFFHTPSQSLYFSSAGHPSYGGYDIYQATSIGKPVHLPAPVNTSYNDVYFSLNADGLSGYLASNRPESRYLDEDLQACCNDIFSFSYVLPEPAPIPGAPDTVETPPVVQITDPPSKENPPAKLEDFLPLALYFDNDEPDRRTRKTSTDKTYTETYQAYIKKQEEYEAAFTAPLDAALQEEALDAIDTFFDQDVEKGFVWLGRFSEILLEKLQAGETVEIFLKGFTSPRAKKAYNLALSQRRISSVRNYFDGYQEGIFRTYLDEGQLIISERPFGEAEASSQVSDALEDLRNSIYHPDAARERRVEIVEIKREK
jgi:tetratricopeptide (TPR) repeat protein